MLKSGNDSNMNKKPFISKKINDNIESKEISLLPNDENVILNIKPEERNYSPIIKTQTNKYIKMEEESLDSVSVDDSNNKNETDDYVIKLRNLHKTYLIGIEGVPALRGVSLNVKRGEFLIIFGTSGGGKTTLLNLIGTIDTPSRGDIKIFNNVIRRNTQDDLLSSIRLKEIAFVFQSFNLFPNMNVLENVEVPMKIEGKLSSKEIRQKALNLLDKMGLSQRLKHYPNQLSGGEQQRVTIARALSNDPKILLLDEPTGDLDTKNTDKVMDILIDLNLNDKITMIMVTHDVGLKNYGNRVVKIVDGKLHSESSIAQDDRDFAIYNLKERIKNIDKLSLREGAEHEQMVEKSSKTFYRTVADYAIRRNFK